MIISQFVQQKMTLTQLAAIRRTKVMMSCTAHHVRVMFERRAGLVLYWLTSNLCEYWPAVVLQPHGCGRRSRQSVQVVEEEMAGNNGERRRNTPLIQYALA
jgi:hypothetical protein